MSSLLDKKLPTITWEFTDRQADFWEGFESGKRVGAFVGGIRGGKTWLGARRFIKELFTRGGLGWVVVPTYTQMGPSQMIFEEALPTGALLSKKETPFPQYILRGGPKRTTVEFRSAEKPDNLRGPSVSVLWLDEAALLDDEVVMDQGAPRRRCEAWEIVRGRVLDTKGPIIITTTPKGKNWLYEQFMMRPSDKMFIVRSRTDENTFLDAEEIADLRKEYFGLTARQELEAEFVSGKDVFFGEWDRQYHVCDPFPIPPSWQWYGGFDDGYTQPFSFGLYAQDPEGTLYRVDEIYRHALVTPKKAEEIANKIGERRVRFIACDPSIWTKKSDTGESTAEVLSRELRKALPRTAPPLYRASNDRIEGWKRCREWINPVECADGGLRARFKVFETCQHFLRTVPAVTTDSNKVEDVDTDQEDHVADEWRYLVMSRPRPSIPSMNQPQPYTGAWFIKQLQKQRVHARYIRP